MCSRGCVCNELAIERVVLASIINHTFQSYPCYYTCTCVGQEPDDKTVDAMMSEAPGPLNFTMFLTLFGEKLNGLYLTSRDVIIVCMM